MEITLNKKNKLTGIISIEIERNDYEQNVNNVLKRYSKTAKIPGFRKGFVPMGLVKKQYGNAVKVDEINKLQIILKRYFFILSFYTKLIKKKLCFFVIFFA